MRWDDGSTGLAAVWFAFTLVVATTSVREGWTGWPPGHLVGVAFVAVVAVPVAIACAALVALCMRWAADDGMALHGTAADQFDAFIEAVRQDTHRSSETGRPG